MKSIIDGMKYDTDLSDIVYESELDEKSFLTLYKTGKGKFYFCNRTINGEGEVKEVLFTTTIKESMEYLIKHNAVDEYEKHFGEVQIATPSQDELKEADIPLEMISKKQEVQKIVEEDEEKESDVEIEDEDNIVFSSDPKLDIFKSVDELIKSKEPKVVKIKSPKQNKISIPVPQKIKLLKLTYFCGTNNMEKAQELLDNGAVPDEKCIRKVIATSNSEFLNIILEKYTGDFVIDEKLLTQVIFLNNLNIFKRLCEIEQPSHNIIKRLFKTANEYRYTSIASYLNTIIQEEQDEKDYDY